MSDVILDSGIFIASAFLETYTPQARTLLQQLQSNRTMLHAPNLLRYEVVAVCRKAVYQGRVAPEEGNRAYETLLAYPIKLHMTETLLQRGYALATLFNRPTAYDAQYLALAEALNCPFWTADERLWNGVKAKFPLIRWIGEL